MIDPKSAAYEFLQQADETLEEARILLKENRPPGAINRSYYAAFYAACALLDSVGLKANSHQAAITLLHREFVRSEKLDRGLLRNYAAMPRCSNLACLEIMDRFLQRPQKRQRTRWIQLSALLLQ